MANLDNKEIYVSYFMGQNLSDGKAKYTEPHIIYGNVSEPVSYQTIEDIGRIPDYDRTVVLDVGEKTEFIREDTILWIDTMPNEQRDNYDHTVAQVGEPINGVVKIYCNAVSPSTQFLYYTNDNENIYQVKVFYNGYTAVVPKNMYFPITDKSSIWFLKPANVNSVKGRIKLVDKVEHVRTYMYVFEDYD